MKFLKLNDPGIPGKVPENPGEVFGTLDEIPGLRTPDEILEFLRTKFTELPVKVFEHSMMFI